MFDDESGGGQPRYTIWRDDAPPRPEIDLDAFTTEAQLEQIMREDARKKGVPARHYDPDWKPSRSKGERVNKDSDAHQAVMKAALRGLPLMSRMQWLEVQIFDNGPAAGRHAHTRFVLKMTGTSAAAGALVNADRRAVSAELFSRLGLWKNFLANLKRKKTQYSLTDDEWLLVEELRPVVDAPLEPGQPAPLFGSLTQKVVEEGTVRAIGQFVAVIWRFDCAVWMPAVIVAQLDRDPQGRAQGIEMELVMLGLPPIIKPNRKSTACAWYGRYESQEFTDLMKRASDPTSALREKMARMRGGRP